jgi:hypothetical protein
MLLSAPGDLPLPQRMAAATHLVWKNRPICLNLGPITDNLDPKPCTTTLSKARRTNKIAFSPRLGCNRRFVTVRGASLPVH